MEKNTTLQTTAKQRIITTLAIVTSILLVPLVAMQFTEEVKWSLMDFVVMGALLLLTGLAIEIVTRKIRSRDLRIGLCLAILLLLFLVWAELAVGVFGTPFAGS
jgi:protein-S-isoprenylcysteine O-methyltransferase Ste14